MKKILCFLALALLLSGCKTVPVTLAPVVAADTNTEAAIVSVSGSASDSAAEAASIAASVPEAASDEFKALVQKHVETTKQTVSRIADLEAAHKQETVAIQEASTTVAQLETHDKAVTKKLSVYRKYTVVFGAIAALLIALGAFILVKKVTK